MATADTAVVTWVGLDGGEPDQAHAEHMLLCLAAPLLAGAPLVCTHAVQGLGAHYACSLELHDAPAQQLLDEVAGRARAAGYSLVVIAGTDERVLGESGHTATARQAAERNRDRQEGRAIRFGGDLALRGEHSVTDLLEHTSIDAVHGLGVEVAATTMVVTGSFVRPRLMAGQVVLPVTPLSDGRVRPFEVETPHRCCEDDH